VRRRWQAGDRRGAAAELGDSLLNTCTLHGTPAEIWTRIAEYHAEGVEVPVLTFPHGSARNEVAATLEALSPNLAPSGW
jgi:alkanesulfonate monooxygenase SsuD/methylene tetrahydromethanopterin reductase-like flavin-dependent oxidoreductase (luciferase family)